MKDAENDCLTEHLYGEWMRAITGRVGNVGKAKGRTDIVNAGRTKPLREESGGVISAMAGQGRGLGLGEQKTERELEYPEILHTVKVREGSMLVQGDERARGSDQNGILTSSLNKGIGLGGIGGVAEKEMMGAEEGKGDVGKEIFVLQELDQNRIPLLQDQVEGKEAGELGKENAPVRVLQIKLVRKGVW